MKKENIILIDNDKEQMKEFKDGIEKTSKKKWGFVLEKSNKEKNSIIRYIKYFIFSFKIFNRRKKFENIIAWQQFYGIIFSFYCRIFHVKKVNKLYICTFIYKDKKKFEKIYYKFIKYCISSKYVDKIICYSSSECEYYSKKFNLEINKFIYLNLGIRRMNTNKYKKDIKADKYILSCGKSNRDYGFLISTLKNTKYQVHIICDNLKGVKEKNIKVYNDVYGEKYFEMLANAYCVVIPLKDLKISSGQLVLLQAMQFKKPVIITETETVKNYIIDSYNGILIKNIGSNLIEAIEKLYNSEELYNKLSENAYKEFEKKYSLYVLGKNIGDITEKD